MRFLSLLLCSLAAICQPPAVRSIIPADGATGVPLNARLLISHSVFTTPPVIQVTLVRDGADVRGTRVQALNLKRPWLVFLPESRWLPGTEYEITVTQTGQAPVRSRFTTGAAADTTPLRVVAVEPADGTDAVPERQPLRIRFNKPVDPTTLDGSARPAGFTLTPVGGSAATAPFGVDTDGMTLVNDETALAFATVYTLRFPDGGPRDWAANALESRPADLYFSTHIGAPREGPRVVVSHPAEGETDVPPSGSLTLRLDHDLLLPLRPGAVQVRSSTGQAATVSVDIPAPNAIRVRPPGSWSPGERYQWTVSGLVDRFGLPMREPYVVNFQVARTEANPAVGWVETVPAEMPGNGRPRWRAARPLSEVLPAQVTVQPRNGSGPAPQAKLSPRLSDGGTALALDRESLPARGDYEVSLSAWDRYALISQVTTRIVRFDTEKDTSTPAYYTYPPDNGNPVPAELTFRVGSREELFSVPGKDMVLRKGTETIPLPSLAPAGSNLWRPARPLTPGEYEWEIRGLADAAGNEIAPVTNRFTVGAPVPEPFRLVSVEPANGAIDVPPTAPLIFTFNRTPDATSLLFPPLAGLGTGDWSFSGPTATFRPAQGWQERTLVSWTTAPIRDPFFQQVAGAPTGRFRVARTGAKADFTVAATEPATGTPLVFGGRIDVQFSGPVLFTESAFSLRADNRPLRFQALYDEKRFRATLIPDPAWARESELTLFVSSAIVDAAGNALTSFAARFPLLAPPPPPVPSSGTPTLLDMGVSGFLTPTQPVVVYLRAEASAEMVAQNVRVDADGLPAAGRIVWTADNRAFTFQSDAPWKDGAAVAVKLSHVPLGLYSSEVYTMRVLASSPPSATGPLPPLTGRSHENTLPVDGVVELAFAEDLPAGLAETLTPTATPRTAPPVDVLPMTVTQLGPRRLRLRPDRAFRPDTAYDLAVKAGERIALQDFLQTGTLTTPEFQTFTPGPTAAMGPAPVNVLIRARFDTLVNPLTVAPLLEAGGATVPLEEARELRDALSFYFRPLGLLPSNTECRVRLAGVTDMTGRAIPEQNWTFTTGAGADRTGFRPERVEPSGSIAVTARPRVGFNKPLYLRAPQGFRANPDVYPLGSFAGAAGYSVRVSGDGRTAEFVPVPAWPDGSSLDGSFRVLMDWTGAPMAPDAFVPPLPVFSERENDSRPLRVTEWTPAEGANDAPRNALVQVKFDGYAPDALLAELELWANGERQRAAVARAADGRVVTLRPDAVLAAGASYTVRFQGAALFTFRTGVEMDVAPLRLRVEGPSAAGAWFRVLANKPLNPLLTADPPAELRLGSQARVATRVAWSADRRELTVFAVTPLPATARPTLTLASLVDWVGFSAPPFDGLAQELLTALPPVMLRVPENGAAVPATTPIRLLFDGVVDAAAFSARLWESGREVSVDRVLPAAPDGIGIVPRLPLYPGETYEVEVTDLAGGRTRWSFTTLPAGGGELSALLPPTYFPPNTAVGVPPDQVVKWSFDRPVYPEIGVRYFGSAQGIDPRPFTSVDGNSLLITPRPMWAAGQAVTVSAVVSDYAGNRFGPSVSFTTAASADTVAPRVEAMSVEEGGVVAPGSLALSLEFSEPVFLPAGALQLEVNGRVEPLAGFAVLDAERRRWSAITRLTAGSQVKLSTTPLLTDLSGNRVTPFTRTFRVAAEDPLAQPVAAVTSPAPLAIIAPDAKFELRFQVPMHEGATRDALRLRQDTVSVPATVEAFEDRRLWRLTPSQPLRAGQPVVVRVESTAMSSAGVLVREPMIFSFAVAQTAGGSRVVNYLARPGEVEVHYSGRAEVRAEPFGIRQGLRRIPVVVERGGEGWLRLRPAEELVEGVAYHLMLGPEEEIPFHVGGRR